MARQEIITREDRKAWELYRQEWQAAGRRRTSQSVDQSRDPTGGGDEIDGEDANRISAFLEGRLPQSERPKFERDLVERAAFLDAFTAASRSRSAGPIHATEMPDSVKVWARNAYASARAARTQPKTPVAKRKGRPWFMRPAFAAASAAAVVMAVGVGGVLLTQSRPDSPGKIVDSRGAASERAAGDGAVRGADAEASSDTWFGGSNSFFQNPSDSYFDGLDID